MLKISGSAGVNISQYVLNDDKSNIVPTTSLSVDFDDTLALKKRISNNAKIRFESTFDVGQVVGASVLDQDLVSYTYITSGLNEGIIIATNLALVVVLLIRTAFTKLIVILEINPISTFPHYRLVHVHSTSTLKSLIFSLPIVFLEAKQIAGTVMS